jgi:alpha,alpha-trehalase
MPLTNIFDLGELFERVQMESVFSDGKTFVDCTPNFELAFIHDRYEEEKTKPGFDLSNFVHENFTLPKIFTSNYKTTRQESITKHIEMLWDVLTRKPEKSTNSLIELPFPYIVPGGRFGEIFYWDSYFTMLGLQLSRKIDMIENMIKNFSFLIDQYGYIPNGNRTYFLGRSQPPFFSGMIRLLSEEKGKDILVEYLPVLLKEYDFWMGANKQISGKNFYADGVAQMPDGSVLNYYCDELDTPRPEAYRQEMELAREVKDQTQLFKDLRAACESGWDFSSRWFKNKNEFSSIHTTEIIPVDLNCLLVNLEETIAEAYQLSGDFPSAEKYKSLATNRKTAINKYCWDEEKGFYFDYDYIENKQKDSWTLAAAFPLYFDIASEEQAEKVAQNLKKKFLTNGGLLTTTETTNQQWDAPNGWAPLHWIAIKGLAKYDQLELATKIAKRWMELNKKVYQSTGKMMEKYNVVATDLTAGGGEYPAQDGFGWTNGVYLALDNWLSQTNKN